MDRAATREAGTAVGRALPSRLAALGLCRAALAAEEPGPVLLTGEAGSGKTWLGNRLIDGWAADRRWLAVDLAPTSDPADLHRALGRGLGLPDCARTRGGLAEFLAEADDDGRRWSLMVDEAHNASAEVLEELRLLSNRLGRPGGFAALLLMGQTRLARRLGTIPLAAMAARIAARVHLRPIDADEGRDLLAGRFPGRPWGGAEADHLHREAGGNPRRLLRLAAPLAARAGSLAAPPDRPESIGTIPGPTLLPGSRLGASRPPLRVEDGLIEVGWDGPEPAAEPATEAATVPSAVTQDIELPSELTVGDKEVVHDHYAALQAWNEWARNQGRQPAVGVESSALTADPSEPEPEPEPEPDEESRPYPGDTNVWADEQHGFAPYSQLFSRLKQAANPET